MKNIEQLPRKLSPEGKEQLSVTEEKISEDEIRYRLLFAGREFGIMRIELWEPEGPKKKGVVHPFLAHIEEGLRGTGAGAEFYRKVNEHLKKHNLVLGSDMPDLLSKDAARLWDSLVKTGDAEKLPSGSYKFKS
jgi:hypothetical protein